MHAAVTEADRAGRLVAAHAHSRDGAAAAVRAGVRSIEHGTYFDEPTLIEMRRRGTFLVPTLAVMSPMSDPQTTRVDDVVLQLRTRQMMGSVRAATRRARELSIDVRTGTIRPGLEADLLVVERDPLRDGSALFEPLLVVADGRVAFERPWPPPR